MSLTSEPLTPVEEAAFKKGARAMYDYLLIRIANNYHCRHEVQAICTAENDLVKEWAEDALAEVSPEDYAQWISINEAYTRAYAQGKQDERSSWLRECAEEDDVDTVVRRMGYGTSHSPKG